MSKEKRSGAESKKFKPFLDIRVYEPVSKKLTIMRESEEILKSYTSFKNETSGGLKSITEDSVIDALICTLNNDAQYIEWKLEKNTKSSVLEASN